MRSYHLKPVSGSQYLAPEEVIRRGRLQFAHIEVSKDKAQDVVGDMIAAFVRMHAATAVIDRFQTLRDQLVRIFLADDQYSETEYIYTTIIPGEPLFISFSFLYASAV